jgi:hypothetical protein
MEPDEWEGPAAGNRQGQPDEEITLRNAVYPRPRQRAGRPAQFWREGFGRGGADACRQAARRLPPETWAVLEQLASEYELAGAK